MKIQLSSKKASRVALNCINLFVFEDASKKELASLEKKLPNSLKLRLREALKKFNADKGFSSTFMTTEGGLVAIVSSSPKETLVKWHDRLRSSLLSALASGEAKDFNVFMGEVSSQNLEWLTTLAFLSQWKHPKVFNKKKEKEGTLKFNVSSQHAPNVLKQAFQKGLLTGESIAEAMRLSHMPANFLTPTLYRKEIESFAKKAKLSFEFWGEKKLKTKGAGAFLAVCQGSSVRDAGIAHLQFKGPGAKKKIAIVGKGICYDTGGYNVKTGNYMFGMHQDMTGSAVALTLGGLIARLKLPVQVDVYLALSENHVSPEAFKMNEVVQASNKKTIEIVHTDAEGRMVLSDTLALASEAKPDVIIDYATLTGSAVRSIGEQRAAVFSNHQKLLALMLEAGDRSGEAVWPFPIGEEYEEALKSKVADLKQCTSAGYADHIYAATFLNHFVPKEIKWIHMDLCPSDRKSSLGLLPKDSSGFGLRWGLQMVEFLSQ